MRKYWQPVALAAELHDGVPLPVKAFGENFVLYQNGPGEPVLMDRHCPHRGADLSYGRCEGENLRCVYHGWLFSRDGDCLETPGEPANSSLPQRVKQRSYPVRKVAGLILAYLGEGDPPPLPQFEWLSQPSERVFVTKVFQACNYLQANEGNLDQVHLSFLHRVRIDEGRPYLMDRETTAGMSSTLQLLAEDVSPQIEIEETPFGFREYVTRKTVDGDKYLKVESFVMPNMAVFPGAIVARDGFQSHWHVPIDDVSHWKYVIVFERSDPVQKERIQKVLFGDHEVGPPHYRLAANAENRYFQDRSSMKAGDFAGFGVAFEIHDTWAIESCGPIQDRSKEKLGYGDRSIIAMRKIMLKAIERLEKTGEIDDLGNPSLAGQMTAIQEVVSIETDDRTFLARRIAERLGRKSVMSDAR